MKKAGLSFFICLLVFVKTIIAQDSHFSQFYNSPLSLNPASTGNFKGDYRLICNYRDQWSSITNLYKTVFASTDFVLMKKKKSGNFLGTGLSFSSDREGKSKMGTTQLNLSIAYNIKLNKYNFLGAGLQVGYAQKGISTANLKWDNQFNGISYDPNLATGEAGFGEQINYIDFGAGVLWNFIPNDKNKITIGASIYHLNKPNLSFSKNTPDLLNPKIVIHSNAQIKIGEKNTSLLPILLFTNQGKLNEINAGGMIKYGLGLDSKYTRTNKSSSVSFGTLYRTKDAFIFLLNMDYKNMFTFGISYDVNISGLTVASRGRGGMEICIVYSGFFSRED